MRIAIATENVPPKVDGIVTRTRHVMRCLATAGHDVTLIAPTGPRANPEGVAHRGLRSFPLPAYPTRRVSLGRPRRVLAELRPDILHIMNPIIMARPAVRRRRTNRPGIVGSLLWNLVSFQSQLLEAAARRRTPVLTSFHTDYFGYLGHFGLARLRRYMLELHRRYYRRSQVTACVSKPLIETLAEHGMPGVEYFESGVDTEHYAPQRRAASTRARLSGGHPELPLLLYVGRLSKEKDVESLRHLFASAELGPLRLAIVGDGPQRSVLEAQFSGTPTVFTGYLYGQELAAAYASADVMVFPSPNEAYGLVLLEALASGLWVVARNRLGVPETIIEGVNGSLYERPTDLVGAVQRALAEPDRTARARRSAESRSWPAVARSLVSMYERAALGSSPLGVKAG